MPWVTMHRPIFFALILVSIAVTGCASHQIRMADNDLATYTQGYVAGVKDGQNGARMLLVSGR